MGSPSRPGRKPRKELQGLAPNVINFREFSERRRAPMNINEQHALSDFMTRKLGSLSQRKGTGERVTKIMNMIFDILTKGTEEERLLLYGRISQTYDQVIPLHKRTDRPPDASFINSAGDVHELMKFLSGEDREHLYVIHLDAKNKVRNIEQIAIGTLTSTLVHPREVFKNAVKQSSAAIICVHNHPSGDPRPSRDDTNITNRISDAGNLLGIELLDHVIIGQGRYYSFLKSGWVKGQNSNMTKNIAADGPY